MASRRTRGTNKADRLLKTKVIKPRINCLLCFSRKLFRIAKFFISLPICQPEYKKSPYVTFDEISNRAIEKKVNLRFSGINPMINL
jgi:hypothetical protein